jgi:hypothetical protein
MAYRDFNRMSASHLVLRRFFKKIITTVKKFKDNKFVLTSQAAPGQRQGTYSGMEFVCPLLPGIFYDQEP